MAFDFEITHAVAGQPGPGRKQTQDACSSFAELGVFALSDGIGGHAGGEIASRLAVDTVVELLQDADSRDRAEAYSAASDLERRRALFSKLKAVVEAANQRVRQHAADHPELAGMGATLDVVWLIHDCAFVAHAGDSRVYLARPRATIQLTHDHARIESLKATGVLRPNQRVHAANPLVNAVGLGEKISVDTLFVRLKTGDRLLLCSDGVHGQVGSEAQLGELLRVGDAEQAADALLRKALERHRDDSTALVVAIGDRLNSPPSVDRGLGAEDLDRVGSCPLLVDLPLSLLFAALSAAVEIELPPGEQVPRVVASDRVAYIMLDGLVRMPEGPVMGAGALLFAESLVGISGKGALPEVTRRVRLLRLRSDDFQEVCRSDAALGTELYRRLAVHLARALMR